MARIAPVSGNLSFLDTFLASASTKPAKVGQLERKPAPILAAVEVPVCPPRYKGDEPTPGVVLMVSFPETQRDRDHLDRITPPELRLVLLRGANHAKKSIIMVDGKRHLSPDAVATQISESMLALFAAAHGELVKQMK